MVVEAPFWVWLEGEPTCVKTTVLEPIHKDELMASIAYERAEFWIVTPREDKLMGILNSLEKSLRPYFTRPL